MREARVNQETVARALGCSQAAVSRRLTGAVDFSVTELRVIADLVGVSPALLLEPVSAGSAS
jgi:transcriptional regulator with XRE-family HTH domain